MTTAAEFRAKADECERQAQEATDVEAKRLLLEASEQWCILAAQAGRGLRSAGP